MSYDTKAALIPYVIEQSPRGERSYDTVSYTQLDVYKRQA